MEFNGESRRKVRCLAHCDMSGDAMGIRRTRSITDEPVATEPPRSDRRIMSTMWSSTPRWNDEVSFYHPERVGTLRDLVTLLRLARGKETVILLGAVSLRDRYRDLVLAAALKFLPGYRPQRILITDATWEPRSAALSRVFGLDGDRFAPIVRRAVKLIDSSRVRYAVLSSDEVETFPQVWGIESDRVVFTPFPATVSPDLPTHDGGYLFAGGNSLRDYDLLEEAVRGADFDTRVASRWSPRGAAPGAKGAKGAKGAEGAAGATRITSGTVPHEEFVALLAGCRAAVVPLQPSVRSAGQQSYLNAMLLGKPVVVTEAPGVRDYIEDGVTGVVVPPEPDALARALAHVMDPANADHYRAMGARARKAVLDAYTNADYFDRYLLDAAASSSDAAPNRQS